MTYLRVCTLDGCTGDITNSNDSSNAVHQCNNSDNGGGSATVCTVDIVNNISGDAPAPATALTLDQCNGSRPGRRSQHHRLHPELAGFARRDPVQRLGRWWRRDLGLHRIRYDQRRIPVTVDQCNGSENGGGSTVTCSTTITTNITDTGTPGGGTPGGGTPGGGTPGGGTPGGGTPTGAPPEILLQSPPVTPPIVIPPGLTG